MAFEISGLVRGNQQDQAFAQGIGQQFAEGFGRGREKRQLDEAQTQLLEGKFAAFRPEASPEDIETFDKLNLAGKLAEIGKFETIDALEEEELGRQNIQSQIDSREAQSGLAKIQVDIAQKEQERISNRFTIFENARKDPSTLTPEELQDIETTKANMPNFDIFAAASGVASPAVIDKAMSAQMAARLDPGSKVKAKRAQVDIEKVQADTDKTIAETDALINKLNNPDQFEGRPDLRKEFNALPSIKAFNVVQASFKKIEAGAAKASPAGDLSMVFSFMKVLDPGSVVRESEFKTAESAKAALGKAELAGIEVPTMVKQWVDRLVQGTILQPEQRQDFLDTARDNFAAQLAVAAPLIEQFSGISDERGFRKGSVVPESLTNLLRPSQVGAATDGIPRTPTTLADAKPGETVTISGVEGVISPDGNTLIAADGRIFPLIETK